MTEGKVYHWSDGEAVSFGMDILPPTRSGWCLVSVEICGDISVAKEGAVNLLKALSYYRPRDRWEWNEIKNTELNHHPIICTYHEIKVRKGEENE